MEDTEKQIITTLEKIRPFIQRDGGDISFVSFKDGIVEIKLSGACEGCSMVNETLFGGVEVILMEEVPGVIGVKLANEQ